MRSRLVVALLLGFVVAFSGCSGCSDDTQHHPDADTDMLPDAGPGETVCAVLPAIASGTCEVTTGGEAKLIKGNILTPETVFRGGQVAVDAAGQITCVGCDCEVGGETQIVCPSAAVSPGLINTHDHITFTHNDPYTENPAIRYDHRHQWRKGDAAAGKPKISAAGGASGVRISWGELRFVMGGATSIVGSPREPSPDGEGSTTTTRDLTSTTIATTSTALAASTPTTTADSKDKGDGNSGKGRGSSGPG